MTPMMQQYQQAKSAYPDMILLFHMGDFYEMFFDDAKVAARVLGLTLTSRSKGEDAIPMAGIPCHAAHDYIRRLIQAGHKVAVCDQVEDPREAKGLVKRDVTRIITPGTLTEDTALDSKAHNYLASIIAQPEKAGLAWVDLSTGQFLVEDLDSDKIIDELARLQKDTARGRRQSLCQAAESGRLVSASPRACWRKGGRTARGAGGLRQRVPVAQAISQVNGREMQGLDEQGG